MLCNNVQQLLYILHFQLRITVYAVHGPFRCQSIALLRNTASVLLRIGGTCCVEWRFSQGTAYVVCLDRPRDHVTCVFLGMAMV